MQQEKNIREQLFGFMIINVMTKLRECLIATGHDAPLVDGHDSGSKASNLQPAPAL